MLGSGGLRLGRGEIGYCKGSVSLYGSLVVCNSCLLGRIEATDAFALAINGDIGVEPISVLCYASKSSLVDDSHLATLLISVATNHASDVLILTAICLKRDDSNVPWRIGTVIAAPTHDIFRSLKTALVEFATGIPGIAPLKKRYLPFDAAFGCIAPLIEIGGSTRSLGPKPLIAIGFYACLMGGTKYALAVQFSALGDRGFVCEPPLLGFGMSSSIERAQSSLFQNLPNALTRNCIALSTLLKRGAGLIHLRKMSSSLRPSGSRNHGPLRYGHLCRPRLLLWLCALRAKQIGPKLVPKTQCMPLWNRLIFGPHGNGRSLDAKGISKGLLSTKGRYRIALIDIHGQGLSGC